jgi:hypothetical protein
LTAILQRSEDVGQSLRQVMRAGTEFIITGSNYQRPGETFRIVQNSLAKILSFAILCIPAA